MRSKPRWAASEYNIMEKKPPYISDKTEMYGGLVSERVIS